MSFSAWYGCAGCEQIKKCYTIQKRLTTTGNDDNTLHRTFIHCCNKHVIMRRRHQSASDSTTIKPKRNISAVQVLSMKVLNILLTHHRLRDLLNTTEILGRRLENEIAQHKEKFPEPQPCGVHFNICLTLQFLARFWQTPPMRSEGVWKSDPLKLPSVSWRQLKHNPHKNRKSQTSADIIGGLEVRMKSFFF